MPSPLSLYQSPLHDSVTGLGQLVPGMLSQGNLDPWNRPALHNPDGSVSTTSSFSFGTKDGEVLIPSVVNGKRLSQEDAIDHYNKTGEHLGIFESPESADSYATWLHNEQARRMNIGGGWLGMWQDSQQR